MKKVNDIIGIDISKLTFDAYGYAASQHQQFDNTISGFRSFLKWVKANAKVPFAEMLIVMEHTGLYSYRLEQYLAAKNIDFTKRSPLDIRRSSGILRGKTDKADARTIARYGWQKREELKPQNPEHDYHLKLRNLMAHRELLVTQAAAHKASMTELQQQLGKEVQSFIVKSSEHIMATMEKSIKATEEQIKSLIASYEQLQQNYTLLVSVKGIGFVTAAYMILYTDNFKSFDDPRKFNSYCGIAPFEYGSGTSIKGKTKVSHLANKKMKSLLHQAAIIAAVHDPEIKAYFIRKKAEGKNKMSVYNAVRVKLVARMFAVIKRQAPFTIQYSYAA